VGEWRNHGGAGFKRDSDQWRKHGESIRFGLIPQIYPRWAAGQESRQLVPGNQGRAFTLHYEVNINKTTVHGPLYVIDLNVISVNLCGKYKGWFTVNGNWEDTIEHNRSLSTWNTFVQFTLNLYD
jgi:hypothetical protein